MPANTARLVRMKIDQYATDPVGLANNVKTLKGMDGVLRLRVGDWRIIFTDGGDIIAVIKIAGRGSAYE